MRKFFHALGFHQWNKWSEVRMGRRRSVLLQGTDAPWESIHIQERCCEICNEIDIRQAS